MELQSLKHWCLSLGIAALAGCYYPSTEFVKIEPVRYVPPPNSPQPNSRFGWVEVSRTEAQVYRVRVGNLTYQKIIEPYKNGEEISYEAAVNAFAEFAVRQVIGANYCKFAHVPQHSRQLFGSQRPPEMVMYVECS